jgi:hypothetical protein
MPGSTLPPSFGNPAASLGFVGFVRFILPNAADNGLVRATSADLRLMQEISKPDVVDSRFDRTVWQLGPKLVEGTIEFPAIFRRGTGASASTIGEELWDRCVSRDSTGHLQQFPIDIKYTATNAAFEFQSCVIDTYTFSVTQSDVVTVSTGIIGGGRDPQTFSPPADIDNVRIVTWNDAILEVNIASSGSGDSGFVKGEFVRSFEVTLANNSDRFYTLNGALAPQDIAPTKRDVTGNLVFMGRLPIMGDHAEDNEDRCFDESTIRFGYDTTLGLSDASGCGGGFTRTLPNCVFEIEEMALTNDLFETTVSFHSLPAASTSDDPLLTSS